MHRMVQTLAARAKKSCEHNEKRSNEGQRRTARARDEGRCVSSGTRSGNVTTTVTRPSIVPLTEWVPSHESETGGSANAVGDDALRSSLLSSMCGGHANFRPTPEANSACHSLPLALSERRCDRGADQPSAAGSCEVWCLSKQLRKRDGRGCPDSVAAMLSQPRPCLVARQEGESCAQCDLVRSDVARFHPVVGRSVGAS
jgi:hypothetical protein